MRLFFALELSPAVAEALNAATAPLRELEPGLAWVAENKLHLTMKFLGEVDEAALPRLGAAADVAVERHRSFPMELAGIGAFPNFRRPRVVWTGVDPDARLELLHHDLEIACEQQGYELEGRAFRPHVTLARVRSPLATERARGFARAAREVAFSATELVERLTLFESTLAPRGAGYRRVHAAPLGVGGR
jgi:2'-5' RNA ligase